MVIHLFTVSFFLFMTSRTPRAVHVPCYNKDNQAVIFIVQERMSMMKVVKGSFGEGKEKTPGEEKELQVIPIEDKVVDFAKAKEELEDETKTDTAFDNFLSSLMPEQLAALDRVTESIADEAFDALDDADELMDELDEEIDKLFDGLDD